MPHELKVPAVGESVQEVQIGQWLKQEGQWVDRDENVVEIETDKASVELPAPVAGTLIRIVKQEGETAEVGEVIGLLEPSEKPEDSNAEDESSTKPSKSEDKDKSNREEKSDDQSKTDKPKVAKPAATNAPSTAVEPPRVMPAAQRLLDEHQRSASDITPTGPGNRLLKEDVLAHLRAAEVEQPSSEQPPASPATQEKFDDTSAPSASVPADREEERVPMSLIRRRIAERLVAAQRNAALLTTLNEIDMTEVIALRKKHGEAFQKKHGVKLGFMSFFVKAAIEALKQSPEINAEIQGREIVYRNYFDIGVAVGGGRGLVVPVLRDADRMSFAQVEQTIGDLAQRAQQNKLQPQELEGGTFTISNGGVYGSLLSTPIVNPPQSGVLGLHAIQDRPVAIAGQVVIRSMMYVALTYDHRLVDGREAVGFLRHIKRLLEDPSLFILEI